MIDKHLAKAEACLARKVDEQGSAIRSAPRRMRAVRNYEPLHHSISYQLAIGVVEEDCNAGLWETGFVSNRVLSFRAER
jgi:hypothetical protein